jgi:hypothetical protein
MMLQPVVSKIKIKNQIILTRFTFDTANACMIPARMALDVVADTLSGLPRGNYSFNTIDASAFNGAYLSIHSWRLSQRSLTLV